MRTHRPHEAIAAILLGILKRSSGVLTVQHLDHALQLRGEKHTNDRIRKAMDLLCERHEARCIVNRFGQREYEPMEREGSLATGKAIGVLQRAPLKSARSRIVIRPGAISLSRSPSLVMGKRMNTSLVLT